MVRRIARKQRLEEAKAKEETKVEDSGKSADSEFDEKNCDVSLLLLGLFAEASILRPYKELASIDLFITKEVKSLKVAILFVRFSIVTDPLTQALLMS